jgi:hypothetical protein
LPTIKIMTKISIVDATGTEIRARQKGSIASRSLDAETEFFYVKTLSCSPWLKKLRFFGSPDAGVHRNRVC